MDMDRLLRQPLILLSLALALTISVPPGLHAEDANNRAERVKEANDGNDFGKFLSNQALQNEPEFYQDGEGGHIGIRGENGDDEIVDRVDVNNLAPGYNSAKAHELQAAFGDEEKQQELVTQYKERDLTSDDSDSAQALRTIPVIGRSKTRLGDDDLETLVEVSLQKMQGGGVGPDAIYADCAPEVEVIDTGHTQPTDLESTQTCEVLNRLSSATRKRRLNEAAPYDKLLLNVSHFNITSNEAFNFQVNPPKGSLLVGVETELKVLSSNAVSIAITEEPMASNDWQGKVVVVACNGPCTSPVGYQFQVLGRLTMVTESFQNNPDPLLMESDRFCTARWTCTDSSPHTIGGNPITAEVAASLTPLYPTNPGNTPPDSMEPALCWAARADYDCDYNLGSICFGDNCSTNTDGNTTDNTCTALEQSSSCHQVATRCADGGANDDGFCYVQENVYACENTEQIPQLHLRTRQVCASNLGCVGEECAGTASRQEQVTNLLQTQGQLALNQHLLSDWSTPEPEASGKDTPLSPSVFKGKPRECRKALGGTLSCCREAETDGMNAWAKRYKTTMRRGSAEQSVALAQENGEPESLWRALEDPSNQTLAGLSRGFTSASDTAHGGQESTLAKAQATSTRLWDITRAHEAEQDDEVSTRLGCSPEETDLALDREIGACQAIGGYCADSTLGVCLEKRDVYCCFASPLSRAVAVKLAGGQEGIANGAFGTPKEPRCGGWGMAEAVQKGALETDTREWVARMNRAGEATTLDSISHMSADSLTGSTSTFDDEDRVDVVTRTKERMDALPITETTAKVDREAQQQIQSFRSNNDGNQAAFGPAYYSARPGETVTITMMHRGWRSLSARVISEEGSAREGIHFEKLDEDVRWPDRDTDNRTVQLKIKEDLSIPAQGLELKVKLTNPSGKNATFYPNDSARVVIYQKPSVVQEENTPIITRFWISGVPTWGGAMVSPDSTIAYIPRASGRYVNLSWEAKTADSCAGSSNIELPEWEGSKGPFRYNNLINFPSDAYGKTYRLQLKCWRKERSEQKTVKVVFLQDGAPPPPSGPIDIAPVPADSCNLERGDITDSTQRERFQPIGYEGVIVPWEVAFSVPGGLVRHYPMRPSAPQPVGSFSLDGQPMLNRYISIPFGMDRLDNPNDFHRMRNLMAIPTSYIPDYKPRPATPIYVTFSPCMGDFREGVTDPPPGDESLLRACRIIVKGADGNPFYWTDSDGVYGGACKLIPGRRYYLNIIFADVRDGVISRDETTCVVNHVFAKYGVCDFMFMQ